MSRDGRGQGTRTGTSTPCPHPPHGLSSIRRHQVKGSRLNAASSQSSQPRARTMPRIVNNTTAPDAGPHLMAGAASTAVGMPRKRFYRQRAHANPLSIHHLDVYVPTILPSFLLSLTLALPVPLAQRRWTGQHTTLRTSRLQRQKGKEVGQARGNGSSLRM